MTIPASLVFTRVTFLLLAALLFGYPASAQRHKKKSPDATAPRCPRDSWKAIPMVEGRIGHTATVLRGGQVLLAGGEGPGAPIRPGARGSVFRAAPGAISSSTETFDPVKAQFTAGGSLITPRYWHGAVQLDNGTVLIVGGVSGPRKPEKSAVLYDPQTGTVTSAGELIEHFVVSITKLLNGRVLIVMLSRRPQLYDPDSGVFRQSGEMSIERFGHAAALLQNGKVLIAGGTGNNNRLASAELYDPSTDAFSRTGAMTRARGYGHTATVLQDGRVLIVGGYNEKEGTLASAEMYDPEAGAFRETVPLRAARYHHSALLLPDGRVLIVGGLHDISDPATAVEIFDPKQEVFVPTCPLPKGVGHQFTASLLPDGKVLVTGGGVFAFEAFDQAWLYDLRVEPRSKPPTQLANQRTAPSKAEKQAAPPEQTPSEVEVKYERTQSPSLDHITRLVEQVEAAEGSQVSITNSQELPGQLEAAAHDLSTFLQISPDNVKALILSVRLGRIQVMQEPIVFRPGKETPPPPGKSRPLHATLDHALQLEPDNPDANYWKARLYSVRSPVIRDEKMYYEPEDINKAIDFSRRAVKLAPNNVLYREALALYLVASNQADEAMAVLRDIQDGKHPIYLLLSDLRAIPIPQSAVLSAEDTENFAQMEMQEGRFVDYPNLRVRAYVLPMRAVEVEKFYRGHWPSFRLFKFETEKIEKGEMEVYAQYLKWRNGELTPVSSKNEVPADNPAPSDGLAISVVEMRGLPLGLQHRIPTAAAGVYSNLVIINFRRFR